MTKDEFVEKERDFFYGLVMDALLNSRHQEPLGAWARGALVKVQQRLGTIFDDLRPASRPAQPQQQQPQAARR